MEKENIDECFKGMIRLLGNGYTLLTGDKTAVCDLVVLLNGHEADSAFEIDRCRPAGCPVVCMAKVETIRSMPGLRILDNDFGPEQVILVINFVEQENGNVLPTTLYTPTEDLVAALYWLMHGLAAAWGTFMELGTRPVGEDADE